MALPAALAKTPDVVQVCEAWADPTSYRNFAASSLC